MPSNNQNSATLPLRFIGSTPFEPKSKQYVHSPLHANEIRLFRGYLDKDGAFHGELQPFRIDSPKLPAFQAASYTWGVPAYTQSITIGGQKLAVLDSLCPLLRFALGKDPLQPSGWWWVDSLCIDQKNDIEKASQVPMMGTIYRMAQRTTVWLGDEADNSTLAIKFLHFLSAALLEDKMFSKEWMDTVEPRDGAYGSDWEAVEKLFARPWWTRVWTVQEYIISRNVLIYCGSSSLSGKVLGHALEGIWSCRRKTLRYENPWNRFRLLQWYNRFGEDEDTKSMRLSLIATLAYLAFHQATDPKDRVYSLAGFVKDFEIVGAPNYNQTVEHLYTKIVQSFVRKYRSLDIICFATIFRNSGLNMNHILPSWVPDWRIQATVMVGPVMVSQSAREWIGNLRPTNLLEYTATYSASLNLEPRVSLSPDLRQITCQGFILDSIDGLTGLPPVKSEKFPRQSDELILPTANGNISPRKSTLTTREASGIMESILRCLTLNRGDHYFSHAIPTHEYSREFRGLLNRTLTSASSVAFLFRAWFTTNQSFHIRGHDLKDVSTKWTQPSSSCSQDQSQFYPRFHDTIVKMSRKLVVTKDGILAMAPRLARKNDLICILYGCSVPVVLRRQHDEETFTFIGECYADGYMNGEALSTAKGMRKRSFRIA